MMQHQFYWRSWWRLWPHYSEDKDLEFGMTHCYLCIGPLQLYWAK